MFSEKILTNRLPLLAGVSAGCLTATAAAAQSAAAQPAAAIQPARPNIILIMVDDVGYSDLGCFGSEIDTPNLDRLAQGGLKLTQFYTTPRCCPTRASVLTGLYSHQAGIGLMMEDRKLPGYRGELARDTVTIAEELKGAGYATAAIGKWHVAHICFEGDGKRQLNFESQTPFWDNKDNWPLQCGFDSFFGTVHGVSSYYDPFTLVDGNDPIEASQVSKDFYYTNVLTDKAVAEIDRLAAGDRPFFMYLAYTAAHWPLQAPGAMIAKYRERYLAGWDKIRADRHQRQLRMGLVGKNWPLPPRDPRVPAWEKAPAHKWNANRMATYAAMIDIMDSGVGRVHETLKARGIDKNTLIIFISDNGGCDEGLDPRWFDVPGRLRDGRAVKAGNNNHTVMAGPEDVWQSYGPPWANVSNTPFRRYKHFTHEGGIATPCIIHWPAGIRNPGASSTQVGHIIDLLPTFADVAGATHPATRAGQPMQPLEGRSLLPVIAGGTRPPVPLFWEHEGSCAVRVGDWKLVLRAGQPWELYNMVTDRTEQNDLAAVHPEKVAGLGKLYAEWAERCHVLPYPLPEPDRQPGAAPD
jgi:arylsulfatase